MPAGATTFVAWYTSISEANEHLSWLRCHPLGEVQRLTRTTMSLLKKALPGSFGRKVYRKRELYKTNWYKTDYYVEKQNSQELTVQLMVEKSEITRNSKMFTKRPQGQKLPYQIGEMINIRYTDMLDFGSFRDQQRHRSVIQRQGLLTAQHGFHEWYLENLPESLKTETTNFIENQVRLIQSSGLSKFDEQYLYPMGMKIPVSMTGSIAKFVYIIDLRAQKTVHPTLHKNMLWLAKSLQKAISKYMNGKNIALYVDPEIEITLKRGTQTILKKEG